jgi:hypothetical protein
MQQQQQGTMSTFMTQHMHPLSTTCAPLTQQQRCRSPLPCNRAVELNKHECMVAQDWVIQLRLAK